MAGYSKRTLTQKLGYKSDQKALVLNAPDNYWKLLEDLPESLTLHSRSGKGPYDFIHLFITSKRKFYPRLKKLIPKLAATGSLWISWPKGSSSIPTDLNRDLIREYILQNTKLVDCKVAAIDEDWSGLKFMIRKIHR